MLESIMMFVNLSRVSNNQVLAYYAMLWRDASRLFFKFGCKGTTKIAYMQEIGHKLCKLNKKQKKTGYTTWMSHSDQPTMLC